MCAGHVCRHQPSLQPSGVLRRSFRARYDVLVGGFKTEISVDSWPRRLCRERQYRARRAVPARRPRARGGASARTLASSRSRRRRALSTPASSAFTASRGRARRARSRPRRRGDHPPRAHPSDSYPRLNRDRLAWLGPRQAVISGHRNPWEKTMTDDAAWPLARHVCSTDFADLPASAVESARRDILDTFGCMLGGSGSPGIDKLFAVIARWGGREESRVLLRGTRPAGATGGATECQHGPCAGFRRYLGHRGFHPSRSFRAGVGARGMR